jgi:hypothetical protein
MNVYKFNDYREFLMEFARLNELTIVSFSDKYSEFFTRSSYGKLIHINKKTGEFTSHHIFDNDKFYKFLKYIGLKKDEADYIFLLKQKADTPENDLKRVYNRAINNIITVKSINNAFLTLPL